MSLSFNLHLLCFSLFTEVKCIILPLFSADPRTGRYLFFQRPTPHENGHQIFPEKERLTAQEENGNF